MAADVVVELTGIHPGFFHDKHDEIIQGLHDGSDDLGQLLQYKTTARTPQLSGALASDVSYQVGTGDVLVVIFSSGENQLDEYGRIYDIYIEGGSAGYGTAQMELGAGSNTNTRNVEMYGRIALDDIPDIEAWGYAIINHVPWP